MDAVWLDLVKFRNFGKMIKFIAIFRFFVGKIFIVLRTKALVKWLWKETHVSKVVGLNPGTVYWMDIFYIYLL